jgi:hypothetical protein
MKRMTMTRKRKPNREEKQGHCSGTTGSRAIGFSNKFKLVKVVKSVIVLPTCNPRNNVSF